MIILTKYRLGASTLSNPSYPLFNSNENTSSKSYYYLLTE